jgi:hypothetical protein
MITPVDDVDNLVGELFPAFALVGAGPATLDREYGIEQQHAPIGPRLQAAVTGD